LIAIHLDNVAVTYSAEPIFESLSWEIHADRCVGLVGPNGCGKSTLLRLIAGELTHDQGFLHMPQRLKIGFMPQEISFPAGQTALQVVMQAAGELAAVEAELAALEAKLHKPDVYGDEKRLARVLERQSDLLEKFVALGGPGFEGHVRATLRGLGFDSQDQELPVEALSGGQQKLLWLACLAVSQPDVLLLDEPDNHLDLQGKMFLERFVRGYPGAVVIVSHDRYLLDLMVDEIAELEDGRLTIYRGNYSEYAFEKELRQARQQQLFQAQRKEIQRLEQSAQRLLTWGKVYDNNKFIRRGQNILKRLERMDKIEEPQVERAKMGLELPGWRGSNKVLELNALSKVFSPSWPGQEENILLLDLDLTIRHGERVGLVGPNGAGKSLLFRLILGAEQQTAGEIRLGPSIQIGYYAQHHDTLDYERTLIDTVRQSAPLSETRAVAFLNRFLFTYEQQRGLVQNLSGGERSRLQLALLMLSGANFLLLDEPTNHLDIPSVELLEDVLAEFNGTVLAISHDRYFLDRVATRILELEQGELTDYPGNYSDYFAVRQGQNPEILSGARHGRGGNKSRRTR